MHGFVNLWQGFQWFGDVVTLDSAVRIGSKSESLDGVLPMCRVEKTTFRLVQIGIDVRVERGAHLLPT